MEPILMRVDSRPQPLSLPHSIRPCPLCAALGIKVEGSTVAAGAPGDTKPSPHDSDPVHWAQSELHFSPDVVQASILRSTARRLMLCCTRQFGKSTVTAIKALQYAWTHPGSLVLVAAPTARQSGEWLRHTPEFLSRPTSSAPSGGCHCPLPPPPAQSGFFYEKWSPSTDSALAPGEPSSEADFPETVLWDRYQVKAGDCPRIAAEFLADRGVCWGAW